MPLNLDDPAGRICDGRVDGGGVILGASFCAHGMIRVDEYRKVGERIVVYLEGVLRGLVFSLPELAKTAA